MDREEIKQGATLYMTWFLTPGALADGPEWEAWQEWTAEHTTAERMTVTEAALVGLHFGRADK